MTEMEKASPGIGLAEAIQSLRQELWEAMVAGTGSEVRFRVDSIELTLETAVTKAVGGKAGIKWWLVEAGAEASRGAASTQTLKLSLSPLHGSEELLVEDDAAPDGRSFDDSSADGDAG
ncbi:MULTISPECIES: trypco2 family protein [Paenarthrobacter]|uniref:trypco2 family protein n=1 Tax=Paenarthrobacter TaxID=1742992 RepID=UPI00074D430C|nr:MULTISPECIES: trypco2 family protein [Paenarthrobacter]AMB39665.1 hypothetical protein AUT26_05135 [Arthrobacter sp. ATCC 21022]BCW83352.1 hypothetical protein NicSoilE8_10250 [Arthrobacter sp. NicSoilE8]QSZ54889.1 hypothetical protein AYX19_19195 [Paenarthrobacter ureafaciens]RWW95895.1 hypothetical protein AUR_15665 [Paenarthrobacter ureafaciens]WOC62065.1 trypco2 family protein [Paenarthrobacter sp. AT5]